MADNDVAGSYMYYPEGQTASGTQPASAPAGGRKPIYPEAVDLVIPAGTHGEPALGKLTSKLETSGDTVVADFRDSPSREPQTALDAKVNNAFENGSHIIRVTDGTDTAGGAEFHNRISQEPLYRGTVGIVTAPTHNSYLDYLDVAANRNIANGKDPNTGLVSLQQHEERVHAANDYAAGFGSSGWNADLLIYANGKANPFKHIRADSAKGSSENVGRTLAKKTANPINITTRRRSRHIVRTGRALHDAGVNPRYAGQLLQAHARGRGDVLDSPHRFAAARAAAKAVRTARAPLHRRHRVSSTRNGSASGTRKGRTT